MTGPGPDDPDIFEGLSFAEDSAVQAVNLAPRGGLEVQVNDLGSFAAQLPTLTRSHDLTLFELSPSDESLESVFAYLVAR